MERVHAIQAVLKRGGPIIKINYLKKKINTKSYLRYMFK